LVDKIAFLRDNFEMGELLIGIGVIILIVLALSIKALRKTIGLLLVILGAVASFTFIGLIVGIPMILVGGFLLFI